jgi:hypothetical protein
MAGYSGTPLPKKLGIKDSFRTFLSGAPPDVVSELKAALAHCEIRKSSTGPLDFVMLFVKSQAECNRGLTPLVKHLAPTGMIWICWPKKASGITTDSNENDIRRIGLASGLVDIKVCAINETWSGLKFVIPVAKRK